MPQSFAFFGDNRIEESFSEKLIQAGYRKAELSEADVVLVFCQTQTELEDAFFDSEGLIQSAKVNACVINMSPTTPSFSRELHAVSLVNDLRVVEAPLIVKDLTQEDTFGSQGNLYCFLAGEDDAVSVALPFLNELFSSVKKTGEMGSAALARAATSIQRAAHLIACSEVWALYSASDFSMNINDTASLFPSFDPSTQELFEAIKEERFKGTYNAALLMAELTAALMSADDVSLILPGSEAYMHLLELLVLIGGGDLAPAALSLVYGEEARCAKHGLDWTRAEETYAEADEDEDDFESFEEFTGGFGGYSSN